MNLHLLNSTGSFIVVGSGIQVVSHRTIGAKMAIEKADKVLTSSSFLILLTMQCFRLYRKMYD